MLVPDIEIVVKKIPIPDIKINIEKVDLKDFELNIIKQLLKCSYCDQMCKDQDHLLVHLKLRHLDKVVRS